MSLSVRGLLAELDHIPDVLHFGRVTGVHGLLVEVGGIEQKLSIGDRCRLLARGGHPIACEVVGFRNSPDSLSVPSSCSFPASPPCPPSEDLPSSAELTRMEEEARKHPTVVGVNR